MKIPRTLRIGGLDWEVIVNHDVNHESHTWGSTHYQSQKIFLHQELNPQKQAEVFLHEILHTVIEHSGYNAGIDQSEEEKLVHAITPTLYQVLKDNRLEFHDGE